MQKKLVAEFADDSYVKMNGSLKLGKEVSNCGAEACSKRATP